MLRTLWDTLHYTDTIVPDILLRRQSRYRSCRIRWHDLPTPREAVISALNHEEVGLAVDVVRRPLEELAQVHAFLDDTLTFVRER
jgi:hypothetical protein